MFPTVLLPKVKVPFPLQLVAPALNPLQERKKSLVARPSFLSLRPSSSVLSPNVLYAMKMAVLNGKTAIKTPITTDLNDYRSSKNSEEESTANAESNTASNNTASANNSNDNSVPTKKRRSNKRKQMNSSTNAEESCQSTSSSVSSSPVFTSRSIHSRRYSKNQQQKQNQHMIMNDVSKIGFVNIPNNNINQNQNNNHYNNGNQYIPTDYQLNENSCKRMKPENVDEIAQVSANMDKVEAAYEIARNLVSWSSKFDFGAESSISSKSHSSSSSILSEDDESRTISLDEMIDDNSQQERLDTIQEEDEEESVNADSEADSSIHEYQHQSSFVPQNFQVMDHHYMNHISEINPSSPFDLSPSHSDESPSMSSSRCSSPSIESSCYFSYNNNNYQSDSSRNSCYEEDSHSCVSEEMGSQSVNVSVKQEHDSFQNNYNQYNQYNQNQNNYDNSNYNKFVYPTNFSSPLQSYQVGSSSPYFYSQSSEQYNVSSFDLTPPPSSHEVSSTIPNSYLFDDDMEDYASSLPASSSFEPFSNSSSQFASGMKHSSSNPLFMDLFRPEEDNNIPLLFER